MAWGLLPEFCPEGHTTAVPQYSPLSLGTCEGIPEQLWLTANLGRLFADQAGFRLEIILADGSTVNVFFPIFN